MQSSGYSQTIFPNGSVVVQVQNYAGTVLQGTTVTITPAKDGSLPPNHDTVWPAATINPVPT